MVEKEQVLQLLRDNQSFLIFGLEEYFSFGFSWDDREKQYIGYKKKQYKTAEDILDSVSIEFYLKDSEILKEAVDEKIEDEIITNYIRKDYRERCRYLLSGKKRNGFANLIQQNKKALNMKRAEKMESCYHLRPQLPEEWEKKKMADKKGYLMTGFCGRNELVIGIYGEIWNV